MVFYYESGDYTVFMTLDRFQNEDLVEYGVPEDIWFHGGFYKVFGLDKWSPTTVYVRLHHGETVDNMSENLLEDCSQLVMENSLYNYEINYSVGYTPWSNLERTHAIGCVGFSDKELIRTIYVRERRNDVLDRLNKTKVEWKPDLRAERQAYEAYGPVDYEARLKDKVRIIREESRINELVDTKADGPNDSNEPMLRRRAKQVRLYNEQVAADCKCYAKIFRLRHLMISNRQIAAASREFQEEFINGFM